MFRFLYVIDLVRISIYVILNGIIIKHITNGLINGLARLLGFILGLSDCLFTGLVYLLTCSNFSILLAFIAAPFRFFAVAFNVFAIFIANLLFDLLCFDRNRLVRYNSSNLFVELLIFISLIVYSVFLMLITMS